MLAVLLVASAAEPPQGPWEAGLRVERQHMRVLGAWSVANLAGGTAGALIADGPRARTFHGTNAAWNTVNLGIAAIGAVGVARGLREPIPDPETVARRHRQLHRVLAVNLALDVGYMAAGTGLWLAGGQTGPIDHRGAGSSLVVQGAFLAAFDAIFLARHRRVTR